MPTRAGWTVLGLSIGTIAAGRLFALLELFVIGGVGVVLCLLAVVTVRRRDGLTVTRVFRPERIHAGAVGDVELSIANGSNRRSPVVALRGPLADGAEAIVWIPPLRSGDERRAAHTMRAERRGPHRVDPISIERTDPLGLARRRRIAVPETMLLVLPRIDRFSATVAGRGPVAGGGPADPTDPRPGASDEFSSLRPYVHGDDLRRVHWRSSARTEDLIVRENEPLADGHLTLLLDLRPGAGGQLDDPDHDRAHRADRRVVHDDALERAISATAGLVDALARHGGRLRLVTTAGDDTGVVDVRSGRDHLLHQLAWLVPQVRGDAFVGSGAVPTMVITARPDASLWAQVTALRPRPSVHAFVDEDDALHPAEEDWVDSVDTLVRRGPMVRPAEVTGP